MRNLLPLILAVFTILSVNEEANAQCTPPVTSAVTGDDSLCAGTSGVSYSVTDTPGSSYLWTIVGGSQADGGTTSSIIVNWNTSAGLGSVSVVETNSSSCTGTAVTVDISINPVPVTSAISGSNTVCYSNSQPYSVTQTAGSTYNWVVTNGYVASGQGTTTAYVNWNNAYTWGHLIVTETTASGCTGLPVYKSVSLYQVPDPSIGGYYSVCTGSASVPYSVINNTPNTSYYWSVVGGTIVLNLGSSIIVTWGSAPGTGSVSVQASNTCFTTYDNFLVTIRQSPTTSPGITGPMLACKEGISNFSVQAPISGSTYFWSAVGGTVTSGQGTSSAMVTWGTATGWKSVSVFEINSLGCPGPTASKDVFLGAIPVTSAITGSNAVCTSTTGVAYSVTNTTGNTYSWTIVGGTQASGTNTNSITVNWGAAAIPASVSVVESNNNVCVGTAVSRAVTMNATPTTSVITGTNSLCVSTNGVAYSVTNTVGSNYTWTITGGTQATGTTTNSITVNWGSTAGAGNVSVVETNSNGCVGAAVNRSITLNAKPVTSAITGSSPVCRNTTTAYSVTNTSGSSYVWTITGGTQATGGTTSAITVNWTTAGAGNVSVVETNSNGCVGAAVNKSVTVNALPVTSAIAGSNSICVSTNGVAYSVTNTAGSSYAWTITGGTQATGTTTSSITVNWGATAGAGNVSVVETNSNGCVGAAVNRSITLNAKPVTSAITGSSPVCRNTTTAYSVTNTSGSSYVWTITGGTQATGGTTSAITVNWTTAGAGNVSVVETNSNGCVGAAVSKAVTVNALPVTSAISGTNSLCVSTNGVAYSVTNTVGSNYTWTITGGTQATGTTTNSITVNWGSTAGAGNVSVVETNSNGCVGAAVNRSITLNAKPVTSAITGSSPVCRNTTTAYSVTNTSGSSYVWTITGGTQATGGTTSAITVNWTTAGAGNVSVVETNSNGCVGAAVNKSVTVNALPVTSAIAGSNSICVSTNGVAYSVTNTAGSSYAWTITGGTQATGTTTSSITVNWGATAGAGNVSVVETNSNGCVGAAVNRSITLNAKPVTSAITGSSPVCRNTTTAYSVTNTSGSSYVWTITGGTQATGGTTSAITVNWTTAGAGNVSVVETNSNGCVGAAVSKAVTVNALPVTSAISGTNSLCVSTNGVAYSVTNTVGSSYTWTITGGTQATGTTTNSITVNWGSTAGAGNVSVVETNSNGCVGAAVNRSVTLNAKPTTSAIVGPNSVCLNWTTSYSVTNTAGSVYTWTITGGTQATGTNTNSITVNWGSTAGGGNVSVVETNSNGCVGAAVNRSVTLNAKPTTSAIGGPNSVCLNWTTSYSVTNTSGSTYVWTITKGTQATGGTTSAITVNWTTAGAGNVSVVETNSNGCVGIAVNRSVTVNALPPTSAITGTNSVCVNTSGVAYSVTNTAGSNYIWTITGGTQATGTTTNSITVNWGSTAGAGNVSVVETNSNGCTTTVNKSVTINALPTVTADNKSTCNFSVVALTGSPSGGTWSGTGVSGSDFYPGGFSPGNYTVTYSYTNANGCSSSANATVTVLAVPTITSFSGVAQVCPGNLYNYSASSSTSGVTYFWTFPPGWTLQSGQGAAITLQVPGINPSYGPIIVRVTAPNGCWREDGVTAYPANGCGGGQLLMAASPESTVFPNPAKNELSVELPGVEDKDVPVALYTDGGTFVARGVIKRGESIATFLDSNIPSGQYVLEIKRNDKTELKRVIIVH